MSGYGTAEHKRKSLAAGFRDHLVKPIDPPELERKLNELASLLEPE
jgi:CheY-like chemotaxis protein